VPNSSLQSNPSDARDQFFQPDWNSKGGDGVSVPANRNADRSFADIYDSAVAGEEVRLGQGGTLPAPTVDTLSPATGPAAGGTVVTVNGDNLTGTTGVTFGGTAGTALKVETDNRLKVTAPAHAAGAVSVVVNTSHGNVTKATAYTYA
jgi:hypothetical protein